MSGTSGWNGWFTSNVNVSLNTNFAGKTERGRYISHSYISSEGTTYVSGSVSSGGKTNTCSNTIKIDKTSPYCSSYINNNGSTSPYIYFGCSDSTSGCYCNGGYYPSSSGTYGGYCYNYAGLSCYTSQYVVKIPEDKFSYSCNCNSKMNLYNASVSINVWNEQGISTTKYSPSKSRTVSRSTSSSKTFSVTATKGNFSKTCTCTTPKVCTRQVIKYKYQCCQYIGITNCQYLDQPNGLPDYTCTKYNAGTTTERYEC